ncbi:MAG TPA: TetR/AcrR family transcriptional regulator [Acidobacteriota bacterium]|nr:TetR/AcrR family transcriptional regulator [Acidobacteriota bacterium]
MTKPKKVQKIEEIRRVTAHLFARKGYHTTSMREIARELGMDKSSLYHYFKSKEELLFKLANDAIDDCLTTLEQICSADIPPEDKLKKVLRFYILYYAGDQEGLILMANELNSLNEEYRSILIKKERRYVELIKDILNELADQGKIKHIHSSIATFAFFGMVHYTINWYHREGSVGLDELADLFVEIFTKGILK